MARTTAAVKNAEAALRSTGAEDTRRRGRPRDHAIDAAILTAARTLLADVGYSAMSLEAVAAMAHTTMPSLRRRYKSKAELVAAVITSLRTAPLPSPSPSPRDDALAVLKDLNRAVLHSNAMTVVGSMLAEEHHHPELLALFRSCIVETRRTALREALLRGIDTNQLPAALDTDAVTSMLCGALYGQYLTTAGLTHDWAERTLAVVWPI